MKEHIAPAIRITLVCLLFFAGVYTLLILGVGKLTATKGQGDLITVNGKKIYANVGQKFTQDRYFWSRPSAVDYNAAGAGGSNKGPTNPDYLATVQARIDSFVVHNPAVPKSSIPSELVTASGSGLDPDISVDAAKVQVARIAKIRGLAAANIEQLIVANTAAPLGGIAGPAKVNVLALNIALDNLK